jgi:predicted DNA-binding transcriptional regulator AlpA
MSSKSVLPLFFPWIPPLCEGSPCRKLPARSTQRGTTVNSTVSVSGNNVSATPRASVMLSRWVNEPLPPIQELLSAHDVARLTRRPKLVISGLVLLRRFPKKRRFRGRQIGWLRADVLEWMTRDLTTDDRSDEPEIRRCARVTPQQPCLPLECTSPRMQYPHRLASSSPASAILDKRIRERGR